MRCRPLQIEEPKFHMTWDSYKSKHRQFLISMYQSDITLIAAGAALESFPKNLPESIKGDLASDLLAVGNAIRKLFDKTGGLRKSKKVASIELGSKPNAAFYPMFNLLAVSAIEGQDTTKIDFQTALFRQHLVMIVAHVEAYLGDCVRAICLAEPRVLQSEHKQITWADALLCQDRSSLIATLADQFVNSVLLDKDIAGLLAHLKKLFKLEVVVEREHIKRLSIAEQVRHIIVHNGGRVDQKFKNKTGLNLTIGEPFIVDESFVANAANSAVMVAQAVFKAVGVKFFKVADPLKDLGMHRSMGKVSPAKRATKMPNPGSLKITKS